MTTISEMIAVAETSLVKGPNRRDFALEAVGISLIRICWLLTVASLSIVTSWSCDAIGGLTDFRAFQVAGF